MSDPVKVGFVGAGNLASLVHYPSLDEIEATDLRAISELDEDKLTATADQYDVPGRYTDYRQMLEREDLDAVYVVMPPHLLHDIVIDCPAGRKACLHREAARRLHLRDRGLRLVCRDSTAA